MAKIARLAFKSEERRAALSKFGKFKLFSIANYSTCDILLAIDYHYHYRIVSDRIDRYMHLVFFFVNVLYIKLVIIKKKTEN